MKSDDDNINMNNHNYDNQDQDIDFIEANNLLNLINNVH